MLFSKQIKFIDNLEDLIFQELKNVINQFGFVLEENIAEDQLFQKGQDGDGEPLKDKKNWTSWIYSDHNPNQTFKRTTSGQNHTS